MHTPAELLRADLQRVGIHPGDTVALGMSLRSIGQLTGGADGFLDIILDLLGPHGTLMMPTYNRLYPLDALNPDKPEHIFVPETTPSTTGIVAQRLRARAGAIRSTHPSNSVTAIGPNASRLTKGHDATAAAYSCFSTLAELKGKFLGIGIGDRLVGMRHEAQSLAGLLELMPPRLGIFYYKRPGALEKFVRTDPGGCTRKLPDLVPPMRVLDMVRDGRVGEAASLVVDAEAALHFMTDRLIERPDLNLCDDPSCQWCAALASRLGKEK